MIRFQPDSWMEALLRFFAMAAPDGNVYVEIAAPDLRFAALVLLAIAVGLFWRRLAASPRPALALLALLFLSTAPWMITSGNGRYWIPMLLSVGPLAVGLIYLLPLTRAFRVFLAAGLLAVQAFAVGQATPWDAWAWVRWKDAPYFHIALPPALGDAPVTTYVTLSSISYSLVAPQFPATSRWINVTSIGGTGRDLNWAHKFLRDAPGPIKLLAPSIQGKVAQDGGPTPDVRRALDALLAPQSMSLDPDAPCRLLRSKALAAIQGGHTRESAEAPEAGFWLCPIRYPVQSTPQQIRRVDPMTEAAFARIEKLCPRFFPPGAKTTLINGGALRHYPGSDMKVYVLDNAEVLYKFWRALNPVLVGKLDDVLSGTAVIDCSRIRGRAGLPWEREI